jgi:hypothetical protein
LTDFYFNALIKHKKYNKFKAQGASSQAEKNRGRAMRKKNIGFDAIGPVMQNVVADFMRKFDPGLLKIHEAWAGIVGEKMVENAVPWAMKNKVLLVHVTSSIWIQELHFLKDDLIMKINQTLGEQAITDMIFKIGPV